MEQKPQDLKISFGHFTEKNAELLKIFNSTIFPVQYSDVFYKSLSRYERFTRLGKKMPLLFKFNSQSLF